MAKWIVKHWKRRRPPSSLTPVAAAFAPRFASCGILFGAGIPACVWFEDALSNVGVPTMVFDLFLVVADVELAAQKLMDAGYQRTEPTLALRPISLFSNRFAPPMQTSDDGTTPLVLLPAEDWLYDLPATTDDMTDWFPPLAHLLAALIAKWLDLDAQESMLRLRIAIFIGYIYEHVKAVRQPGFEDALPRKYWTFHFDQVQGINAGDLGTTRCQMHYLSMIGEGT